jgi:hypothetical protein
MSALRLAAALAIFLSIGRPVLGQVPDSARTDSTARDSTDYSELFLKTQEESRVRVRTVPRFGSPALLPALTRMVFDRDTIDWHNAETLSDLLTKIPGVYLWRGGWIGRPEPIDYQARGAASVEYFLDGFPFMALGPDSLAIDPSLFPLSFLSRVEVERLPGLLRIHLFSRRHDRLTPRTRVAVSSGDFDIARYQGSLEKRFSKGIGYAVAAEHLAVPLSRDQQGSYRNTAMWLQTSYVPSNRLSIMAQYFRNGPDREDVLSAGSPPDTLSQGLHGSRSDFQASVLYSPKGLPLGPHLGLFAGASAWREDSTDLSLGSALHTHVRYVDQSLWQFGGTAGIRSRSASFDARVWHRSRWIPLEAKGSAAFAPASGLSATVEGTYGRYDGGRTAHSITARAGLQLPLQLRVAAIGRTGTFVDYPTIPTVPTRTGNELGLIAGFDRRRLALEAGYWHTDAFAPRSFPLYHMIAGMAPIPDANWLTVSGRIAPRQWFILDGWYSSPAGDRPEGQPPTHSIVNATIQSKFLRTFRSGIFGLKLQATMESWGTGVLGRDVDDNPITLKGATFFRGLIALQIGDFLAYYDRTNLRASRLGYVPGLSLLRLPSTFGVRWEFSN